MSKLENKYVNTKQLNLLLVGAVATILILGFEGLAVTAIMPKVMEDLNAVNYYPLAGGISVAIQIFSTALSGIWCDSKGPRYALIFGISVFVVGLFLSGIAYDSFIFILGRAVQGLGAGMLIVPFYVIVGSHVEPIKRPMFFATFSASWIIPALIGPYAASIILKYFGWRMVFLSIPPLIFLSLLLLIPLLVILPSKNLPLNNKTKRTLFGALGAGIFVALSQISAILPTKYMILSVIICILCASFSLSYVLPKKTFTLKPGISSLILARSIPLGVVIGIETLIPLILVIGRGWNTQTVALMVSSGSICWFLGSYTQSRVKNFHKRQKLIVIGGALIIPGSFITILGTFDSAHFLFLLIGWAISSYGSGMLIATCAVLALEITPEEEHGNISSVMQVGDSYATAVLIALIGVLYTPLSNAIHPIPFLPSAVMLSLFSILGFYASYITYKYITRTHN